jgi:hypothetical protein
LKRVKQRDMMVKKREKHIRSVKAKGQMTTTLGDTFRAVTPRKRPEDLADLRETAIEEHAQRVPEALDRIGDALKGKGLTLEDLMESGREIRGKLLEKECGLESEE